MLGRLKIHISVKQHLGEGSDSSVFETIEYYIENTVNYSPERKYLHLHYNTEDTESTEGLCFYFLYSVFSVLSVVKLSLVIGERNLGS